MHGTIFHLIIAGSALALPPRTLTTAPNVGRGDFAEVQRLQSHFDSVDVELRTSDESHLTDTRRARRAELVQWLRAYRQSGQFPLNDGVADRPIPIFRDRAGVLCAMAYLIQRSARGDLVERIATTRNFAYIQDLVDDADLVTWLEAHGLSAAEAARIQPTYSPELTSAQKIETKFLWESGALIVFDATATAFSLSKPSQRSVLVGLIGGVSALAVGSAHLGDEGSSRTLARVTTTVGGVTTGVAFWRALTPQRWHDFRPMRRAANILSSVRAEPVVLPTGAIGRHVGWGMAFR